MVIKKIGRNDLCWCGSSKKYKNCHLERDKQEPLSKGEILKSFDKFKNMKYCSAPDIMYDECSQSIIKAHSISKSSSLKEISNKGHVYSFFNPKKLSHNRKEFSPELIGLNKASIFNGFCSYHDKNIFSPIENSVFLTQEYHCFLIAYRSLCRELFVKKSAVSTFEMVKELDKGKKFGAQFFIQGMANKSINDNSLTLNDLLYLKRTLDNILINKQYNKISHTVFEFDYPTNVMCSAVVAPTMDLHGNILQSLSNKIKDIPDYIFLNSFSSQEKGYWIVSWLPEHSTSASKLIQQLKNSTHISNTLTLLAFVLIENIYFSPVWWNSLSKSQKDTIGSLYFININESPINIEIIKKELVDSNLCIKITDVS